MILNDLSLFRHRWLADAALGFPRAGVSGVADSVDDYVQQFHRLRAFDPEEVAQAGLRPDDAAFLVENGLPEEAPLFLRLADERALLRPTRPLRTAGTRVPLGLYVDGSGSLIGLGPDTGRVVWLDHETSAQLHVNASLPAFCEFLRLSLRISPRISLDVEPRDIDPPALVRGAFWTERFA